MLNKETKIKCGWCNSHNKAVEWNDLTYSQCKSREHRRAYTPIYKEKTFRRGENTFYKCPTCETWSRGCQLSIVGTKDKKLLRLGGEPVMQELRDNEFKGSDDNK